MPPPWPWAPSFTRQQAALGLGHAVLCARDIIGDEPFAVLLPDVIVKATAGSCLKQMVDACEEVGGNIIAVDEVPQDRRQPVRRDRSGDSWRRGSAGAR